MSFRIICIPLKERTAFNPENYEILLDDNHGDISIKNESNIKQNDCYESGTKSTSAVFNAAKILTQNTNADLQTVSDNLGTFVERTDEEFNINEAAENNYIGAMDYIVQGYSKYINDDDGKLSNKNEIVDSINKTSERLYGKNKDVIATDDSCYSGKFRNSLVKALQYFDEEQEENDVKEVNLSAIKRKLIEEYMKNIIIAKAKVKNLMNLANSYEELLNSRNGYNTVFNELDKREKDIRQKLNRYKYKEYIESSTASTDYSPILPPESDLFGYDYDLFDKNIAEQGDPSQGIPPYVGTDDFKLTQKNLHIINSTEFFKDFTFYERSNDCDYDENMYEFDSQYKVNTSNYTNGTNVFGNEQFLDFNSSSVNSYYGRNIIPLLEKGMLYYTYFDERFNKIVFKNPAIQNKFNGYTTSMYNTIMKDKMRFFLYCIAKSNEDNSFINGYIKGQNLLVNLGLNPTSFEDSDLINILPSTLFYDRENEDIYNTIPSDYFTNKNARYYYLTGKSDFLNNYLMSFSEGSPVINYSNPNYSESNGKHIADNAFWHEYYKGRNYLEHGRSKVPYSFRHSLNEFMENLQKRVFMNSSVQTLEKLLTTKIYGNASSIDLKRYYSLCCNIDGYNVAVGIYAKNSTSNLDIIQYSKAHSDGTEAKYIGSKAIPTDSETYDYSLSTSVAPFNSNYKLNLKIKNNLNMTWKEAIARYLLGSQFDPDDLPKYHIEIKLVSS